jgi:hypothetical protein
MEQKLVNQFEDDLVCLKKDKDKLVEFKEHLNEFNLPSDIEKRIEFEVSSDIDIYESEIEQLSIDLCVDEEEESQCDLEGKYQETVVIED